MNRRDFLVGGGALAVTGCVTTEPAAKSPSAPVKAVEPEVVPLLASEPVLQNAAATSIGVAFAVSADASGWVEIGERPDLSDGRKVFSGGHGMMRIDDRVAQVRLTGLKPATKYYYRIGADRISYKGGYGMKNLGPETAKAIHSFTTLGEGASGSFCVINDTHDHKPALKLVFGKLDELKPSVVIWNGDASNTTEELETAMGIFVRPHPDFPAYAADTPYAFLNGNHDYRGRFNRRLEELMMFREPTERRSEFYDLGRNFVQRLGEIALIGLDTGEDKLDSNRHFAGIFRMREYRELQTRWLAEVIESEAVKTAKFKVVFCHIPLFDSNPRANPGDIAPDDTDFTRYEYDFAIWQRTCANLWSPYFERAGVQLVICAHEHEFRCDEPSAGRSWTQIVGGGPDVGGKNPKRFPTVIEGRMESGKLRVSVHDAYNRQVVFDRVFA